MTRWHVAAEVRVRDCGAATTQLQPCHTMQPVPSSETLTKRWPSGISARPRRAWCAAETCAARPVCRLKTMSTGRKAHAYCRASRRSPSRAACGEDANHSIGPHARIVPAGFPPRRPCSFLPFLRSRRLRVDVGARLGCGQDVLAVRRHRERFHADLGFHRADRRRCTVP